MTKNTTINENSSTPVKINSSEENGSDEQEEMSLADHITELRTRLIYSLAAITLTSLLMYLVADTIFTILNEPFFKYFPQDSLIGTGPAEAFLLKLKTAFFAGMVVSSPFLFYQAWEFIAPGLLEHEKKLAIPFIFFTSSLFLGGVVLCYKLILPVTYSFFLSQYQSIGVTPQIRISEHFSLSLRCLIGFGLAFEIPVISYFLGRFQIISSKQLISWIRYAIVGIFALAAIITPTPDIVTQTLFALPLLVLYVISIFVVKYVEKQRDKNSNQD